VRGIDVPEPDEDFTADPVELFFDLSYVFAFAQLVYLLAHDPTWQTVGRASVLFALIWLTWSQFTWSANAVSGNGRVVRVWFLVATVAAVPMGASIQTAFGSGGPAFAASQVVILGMGLITMVLGLPKDSEVRNSIRAYAVPNVAVMPLLLLGGILPEGPRLAVWVGCLFVIVVVGQGLAGSRTWLVRPGHFAERHGLILIVALGEVVVASALGVAEELGALGDVGAATPDPATFVALAGAGLLAALLWWSYFGRAHGAFEHAAERLEPIARGAFARDVWSRWHLLIVAGVIAVAAALEEVTLHPGDVLELPYRAMFAGGLVLVLGGVVGAVRRAFGTFATERALAGLVLAVGILLASGISGLTLLLLVDVLLLAVFVEEYLRIWRPGRVPAEASA
jgi:low temperature requirement protein LtrA